MVNAPLLLTAHREVLRRDVYDAVDIDVERHGGRERAGPPTVMAHWSPLIHNLRHCHGLAPELGHGFRSETAKAATRVG